MFRHALNPGRFGIIILLSVMLVASMQLFVPLSSAQSNALTASQSTSTANAQNIGHSVFVMAQNSSSIYLNSSLALPFNVILTSGTPGTTYLIIANGNELAENGIYVGINPSNGIPTFSGMLYVNTNVKPGVVPGVYTLMIETGGADPITGVYNFTLTVHNTVAPPSTVATSTAQTTSYSVTYAPTTIAQKSSASLLSLGTAGIIVILVIVIIVFLAIGARRRQS